MASAQETGGRNLAQACSEGYVNPVRPETALRPQSPHSSGAILSGKLEAHYQGGSKAGVAFERRRAF